MSTANKLPAHATPQERLRQMVQPLLRWFAAQARELPWRADADPYRVWISEIMLQQTRVEAVRPYYARFLAELPDVRALAAVDEERLLKLWEGLGYYSRARNLHRLAKVLVERHGGEFPGDADALRALPGVGEYTAAAIRAFAFDLPAPVLDANIERVLARLLNFREPINTAAGKKALRDAATALQPPRDARIWNSALMELGALICKAGAPDCLLCPVAALCKATAPELLPVKPPRPKTIIVHEARALVIFQGKIHLEQSHGPRWRGLWILPLIDPPPGAKPLATMTYPITRFRVTLDIFLKKNRPALQWRGFSKSELDALPLPSPHRKALALCAINSLL